MDLKTKLKIKRLEEKVSNLEHNLNEVIEYLKEKDGAWVGGNPKGKRYVRQRLDDGMDFDIPNM